MPSCRINKDNGKTTLAGSFLKTATIQQVKIIINLVGATQAFYSYVSCLRAAGRRFA